MKVHVLQHEHVMIDGTEDVKFIGVYSSREKAQAAIKRLGQAPIFSADHVPEPSSLALLVVGLSIKVWRYHRTPRT